MDDVNWELIILIIIVALIAFAVLGIYIGTLISSDKRRIRELEGELSETRKELEGYRSKVNNHFKKTSELFTQMTSTYKAVYMHLAEGSQELCTTDAALLNPSNGEFLKVTHEEQQHAAEETPELTVEKPVPMAETPEKPKQAETWPSHTSPAAEAEKPEQLEPPPVEEAEKPEQMEPPPVEEGVKEEAADTAEPASTQEDKKDLDADELRGTFSRS